MCFFRLLLQVLRQAFEVLASVTAKSPKCIQPVAALLQTVQAGTSESHDVFATALQCGDRNTMEVDSALSFYCT